MKIMLCKSEKIVVMDFLPNGMVFFFFRACKKSHRRNPLFRLILYKNDPSGNADIGHKISTDLTHKSVYIVC